MHSEKESTNPVQSNRSATTTPLVDINLVTYNHEKFIAQAIESVLEQETDFEYRLIIGDDCSTDNTQQIIRKYAQQYPRRIQVLLNREHRGIEHKDRVGIEVFRLNKAKYVALLDGDDYWTAPDKLQKQVEFLEARPECAICFHNVEMFHENHIGEPRNMCPPEQKRFSTLEDLIRGIAIPTCSIMFRRGVIEKLPGWFHEIKMGDWALNILIAQFGSAGYLSDVMAAYRVHESGEWSRLSLIQKAQETINFFQQLDEHLKFQYHRLFKRGISKSYLDLALEYDKAGETVRARECALKSISLRPFEKDIPSRLRLKLLTRLCAPTAYRNLKAFLYGPLERNL